MATKTLKAVAPALGQQPFFLGITGRGITPIPSMEHKHTTQGYALSLLGSRDSWIVDGEKPLLTGVFHKATVFESVDQAKEVASEARKLWGDMVFKVVLVKKTVILEIL